VTEGFIYFNTERDILETLNADGSLKDEALMVSGKNALFCVATGSGNAFVLTYSPAISALVQGVPLWFKANHTITGAATANPNGLGVKAIKKNYNEALEPGDIVLGQILIMAYDSVNDWFQIIGKMTKPGQYLRFCIQGNASVASKVIQVLMENTARTITRVQAYADTAPVGADLIIDININGTSIWASTPANRLKITAGSNSGNQTSFDTASIPANTRVSVDIDQVGSSTPGGNDLLINIEIQ
jgi:hypothetical protein